MKRYITNRESVSMALSTMAVTGNKLYDLAFWSFKNPTKEISKGLWQII